MDYNRVSTFFKYGTFFYAPFVHCSFKYVYSRMAGSVWKQLLVSQTIFTYFSMSLFFIMIPLLDGKSVGEA